MAAVYHYTEGEKKWDDTSKTYEEWEYISWVPGGKNLRKFLY